MPVSITRLLIATAVAAILLPAGALAATEPHNGAVAFSAKRAGGRVIYTRERDGTGLKLIDTAGLADHPAEGGASRSPSTAPGAHRCGSHTWTAPACDA